MKLLKVPGDGFLFVVDSPLGESHNSDVVVIPQSQIEELLDADKTREFDVVTEEFALALKMHLLQEQIAFFENKEKLAWKIRNAEDFPELSPSREEIENEWQNSLDRLRLLLAELKKSVEEEN